MLATCTLEGGKLARTRRMQLTHEPFIHPTNNVADAEEETVVRAVQECAKTDRAGMHVRG